MQAWNVDTGQRVWMHPYPKIPNWGSMLTTGGNLVFSGGPADAEIHAFDATTGKLLWEFETTSGIVAPPSTFMVDGKQYLAVHSGWGGDPRGMQAGLNRSSRASIRRCRRGERSGSLRWSDHTATGCSSSSPRIVPAARSICMVVMTSRRTVFSVLGALVLCALPLAAQADKFDKKVAFEFDKPLTLDGVAGPVKISSVKITNLGRGYSRGGISFRSAGPPSELSTVLRFVFDVNNPTDDEWDVTFTVELLDKSGKVIDRTSKKENYEDEATTLTIEHPLLEYVVPLVSELRITLQGRRS